MGMLHDAQTLMQVTDHARQLLEKHLGMPFLNAGYSGPTARMNLQQVLLASPLPVACAKDYSKCISRQIFKQTGFIACAAAP